MSSGAVACSTSEITVNGRGRLNQSRYSYDDDRGMQFDPADLAAFLASRRTG
jgi:hypothetical protein